MMKLFSMSMAAVLLAVFTIDASAQGAGSLKGAWKVVAVTGADGKTDSAPQPGLYIFTDKHYSIQVVRQARTVLPEKASEKERLAAYDPYTANSGTYEVKGNVLTTKAMVAKNPNVMAGPGGSSELKFEGTSTVHITSTGPAGKTVTRLQRVE